MVKLPHFIVYVLHRMKLHPCITFAAPVLLQCPKARFPTAQRSSDHRLFVSAFMLASKVIYDKLWSTVVQGMFMGTVLKFWLMVLPVWNPSGQPPYLVVCGVVEWLPASCNVKMK